MSSIGHLPGPKVDEKAQISGLHNGTLTPEARARRAAKNARNASRAGEATRPRGSNRKHRSNGSKKRR